MKKNLLKINFLYTTLLVLLVGIPFLFILINNRGKSRITEISKSLDQVSESFAPNYAISLPGGKGKIAFRNRALSAGEYWLIGRQNEEGKRLHEETYAGIVSHGTRVQLLDQIGPSLKVRIQIPGSQPKEGFIAISVDGIPTLTQL